MNISRTSSGSSERERVVARPFAHARRYLVFSGFAASLAFASSAEPAKKITYEDDVLPIFRDNCLKCHNPDKLKGDLDLTSFSGTIKGGGSGVTLNAGDPEGSQLFKSITHAEDPAMPPKSKLSDKEIGLIRQWIAGGLLQGVNSKALAANKPTVDLALKSSAIGKPDGPPPMPGPLAIEPFVHATRGTPLSAIAASPWAPVVALGGARQIALYHTGDLEYLGVLPFPEGTLCDLKFSRNGKLLLASGGRGGHSGLVTVWDLATAERVITVGDQFDSVLAADISADQQWIALGGPDRVLKIYRTKDGSLEHRIKKHTEWVTALEFSPDSKYLATGDRNGGLMLWEAATGQEMFNLPGHKGAITAITWRSDSELFASASEDGTLKLWKAGDGSALRSITTNPGGTLGARFAHDGRIVTCGRDNKVQLWDTTGKNLATLPFSGDLPNRVTFSEDGKKVVGSDWRGTVLVWSVDTNKVVGELDANPPTLNERVERGRRRIAAAQTEITQAAASYATAVADEKLFRTSLGKLKQSLADLKTRLTANELAAHELTEQAKLNTANPALKAPLAAANESIKQSKARITTLQKEVTDNTVVAAGKAKKTIEAKAWWDDRIAKLAAENESLAKWTAAQQSAKAGAPTGKMSLAEPSPR